MRARSVGIIILLVPFLLGLAALAQAAGKVEAWLDRSQVSLGETVRLTIQADGRFSGDLDTSPLDKDFQVLGTSSGSSINIVNGSVSSSKTWQITLQPKRQGTLTIPPLEIGGQRTNSLSLVVSASPAPQADAGADIFIETDVEPHAPYEQQEVVCQVRLFHAVKLAGGSLTAPQPNDTVVQQLGKDRTYQTTVHGRHYEVIERTYALFPQQAGTLTIAPPVFEGKVVARSRSGNPFGSFFGSDPFGMFATTTKPVRITGQAVPLTVRPRPKGVSGSAWLPADSVELSEQWQPDRSTVRVGDAVTRTVTITATGQNGAALPDLAPGQVKGFQVYPDKAEEKTDTRNGSISGISRQKIAFIPVRPGTFTLPAVNLSWWDLKAGRMRKASLPPRTITVLPGNSQFAASPPPAPSHQKPEPVVRPANKSERVPVPVARPAPARRSPWSLVALGLGAGWLLTLLLWSRDWQKRGKRETPPAPPDAPPPAPSADPRRELRAACASGDAARARRSLLQWAAHLWPDDPPKGLSELAGRMEDEEAARAVAELDRYLFSAGQGAWDGKRLAALVKRIPEKTNRPSEKDPPLPPLYP